jgi:hypothetical protein
MSAPQIRTVNDLKALYAGSVTRGLPLLSGPPSKLWWL